MSKKTGIYDLRKTKEQFIKESNEVHGIGTYDYSLVDYKNNKVKVKIICKEHGIFEKIPKDHIQNKRGCTKCLKINKKKDRKFTFEEYVNIANKKHNFKYTYVEYNYKTDGLIKVKCDKHEQYVINYKNHLKYQCQKCYFEKIGTFNRKSKDMFIKEANKIHEEGRYDYSLSNYKNGTTPIIIICNICNNKFKQIPKNHIKGAKCTFCNESNGEKAIEEYFLKENINYKKQYFFNDCRNKNPLRFDFYLPDYNLCIEFDGIQHYDESSIFWSETAQRNDLIKNNY